MSESATPNLARSFYLPRLDRIFYQADAVVHWELTIAHRRTAWLNDNSHAFFREIMLHVAHREGLLCPTYLLMPDHLHLVWMGLRADTDQLHAMTFLRTHFKSALGDCEFQHQPFDHVLRDEERRRNAFARVCSYILENAVKSELVALAADWRYQGAVVPGYPTLTPIQPCFWPKFWTLYHRQKAPESAQVKRPPRITLAAAKQARKPAPVAADVRTL